MLRPPDRAHIAACAGPEAGLRRDEWVWATLAANEASAMIQPSRHPHNGPALGGAADPYYRREVRIEIGRQGVTISCESEIRVGLVNDQADPVGVAQLDQGVCFGCIKSRAGWIGWRGEDHGAGARTDVARDVLCPAGKTAVSFRDGHRPRANTGGHGGVGRVAGLGMDELVAGLEQGREKGEQPAFGAARDGDLVGSDSLALPPRRRAARTSRNAGRPPGGG